jgi:hypothetical protein
LSFSRSSLATYSAVAMKRQKMIGLNPLVIRDFLEFGAFGDRRDFLEFGVLVAAEIVGQFGHLTKSATL